MDPAGPSDNDPILHNAELQAIFRQELEQRATNLVDGATHLATDDLNAQHFEDLARDAHTIKGNAGVMGFEDIAALAKALEQAWRGLHEGRMAPTADLERDLAEAAELVPRLVEPTAISSARAQALTEKLDSYSNGRVPRTTTAGDDAPEATSHEAETVRPQAAAEEPDNPPAGEESPVTEEEPSSEDDEFHRVLMNGPPQHQDLGGLISSLERRIIGTNTRVETGKLYRLINSIAEARLDAEALEAAATEGGEGSKLVSDPVHEAAVVLTRTLADLQNRALDLAATPLEEVTDTFPQLVRYLSRRTGKEVRFEIGGVDVEVDRQIVDHIREPLRHLIVNAVDHGIETPEGRAAADKAPTACVAIRTSLVDNKLQITVEDDGRGIDWDLVADVARRRDFLEGEPTEAELSRVLFLPAFSTLEEATDLSGDGSGLAAVAELAEMLNGGVTIQSEPGRGTSFVLTLPGSWALQDVVLARAENKQWGIPATAVLASFPLSAADIRPGQERMELVYQGHENVPISSFAAAVGLPEVEPVEEVIVLSTRVGTVAVTVPGVVGRRQVAVKGLGPLLSGVPHLTGAALLGGGEVVVVVDPNRLGERVRTVPSPVTTRTRILVVDDSMGVRQLISAALTSHGFETIVAADAAEALDKLSGEQFDALVVDYSMPGPSGVDLITAVRKSSISLPIVMVSAVASADNQAEAWTAGVDAYLDKFDLRTGVLASTLRSLVQLRGTTASRGEDA